MIIMVPTPERAARRLTLLAATALVPMITLGAAQAQQITPQSGTASAAPTSTFNGGLGVGVPQPTSLGSGLVNLRDLVDSPALQGESREFSYQLGIGAFAGYTDNVALTSTPGGGSAQAGAKPVASTEERINPSIGVALDTQRIQGSLNYAPTLQYYNEAPHSNRIAQNLSANALGTVVEDAVFVNVTANAAQVSNSQLSAYNHSVLNNSQATTQSYSYGINPYFVHRFGDFATMRASYNFTSTIFDNSAYNSSLSSNSLARLNNSTSTTQTEDLQVTSGPDFEIFTHALEASASQFSGGGSERNGYRNLATYTIGYAVNRAISLTAMLGYESLHYSGTSIGGVAVTRAYNINGPIGQAGVKYTPNEDSSLSVLYGHIDGGDSWTVTGSMHPTARINVSVEGSTALTTNGQDLQAGLSALNGSHLSGSNSPTLGLAGYNNQLYRLTRISGTAAYALDLDSFSLNLSHSQTGVPNALAAASTYNIGRSSNSSLASLMWQHSYTETISSSVGGTYGLNRYNGSTQPVVGVTVRVSDQISQSLSAELDYTYTRERSYLIGASQKVQSGNEILAGLVEKF